MLRQLALRALLPLALLAGPPAMAQEPPADDVPAAAQEETDAAHGDIVVNALRLRADEELPAETSPTPGMVATDARRFTRCAGLPRPDLLRRILDGRP